MIVLGVLVIGLGLLMIGARDFFWSLTSLNNSFAGRQSERTELWEAGQIISGVVLLLIGVGAICAGIGQNGKTQARSSSASAAAGTMLADVAGAFGPYLAEWQSVEGRGLYAANPRALDIDAEAIYYGRCKGDGFFLVVVGFQEEYRNYGYFPDGDPGACRHDGISMAFVKSIGGDWYSLTLLNRSRIAATPRPQPETPAPTATAQAAAAPR